MAAWFWLVGAKPRELLGRYGKQQIPMKIAAPIVARTLLDTASANGVGLVDVMSIVTKVLAKEFASGQLLGGMLAVPGFSDLHTPVVLSSRGGILPSVEFQVPFGTCKSWPGWSAASWVRWGRRPDTNERHYLKKRAKNPLECSNQS